MINFSQHKYFDSELVLDEVKYSYFHNKNKTNIFYFNSKKIVLIGLLQKHFFDNLRNQKFPSHVIIVRKEDLLNVKEIKCSDLKGVNLSASKSIDLSNLETLSKYILFFI